MILWEISEENTDHGLGSSEDEDYNLRNRGHDHQVFKPFPLYWSLLRDIDSRNGDSTREGAGLHEAVQPGKTLGKIPTKDP